MRTFGNLPPAFSIAAVSSVVVDLPFVPVIATMVAGHTLAATSNSPRIERFLDRASHKIGISSGTPGETTIKSASVMHSKGCPLKYVRYGLQVFKFLLLAVCALPGSEVSLIAAISAERASRERVSVSVTTAPRECNNFAAAIPLRFKPKTVTRFPCNCIIVVGGQPSALRCSLVAVNTRNCHTDD